MEYHHPDVVKALAFNKRLNGRDVVAADLRFAGDIFPRGFKLIPT